MSALARTTDVSGAIGKREECLHRNLPIPDLLVLLFGLGLLFGYLAAERVTCL
jgi:hypothetical protein